MLRHRRLGDAELALDDLADGAGRELAVGHQLEDPPPDRVAQNVERMHGQMILVASYISQPWHPRPALGHLGALAAALVPCAR